jgi:uncharacterized membrane protein
VSGLRWEREIMQLLVLLVLLVGPYIILTLAERWITGFKIAPATRARAGVTLFFLFTSLGHFIRTEEMSAMVPPSIPYRMELIYLTGVLEFLGAIGVWIPRLMRLTGLCLILMLICLLPANIYSAINRINFGGHGAGPTYLLLRVPFQVFAIWWTYGATEQEWFRRQLKEA